LVTFHLTAEIDTPRVGLPEIAVEGTAADAIVGQRELYTDDDGVVLAPVYDREQLPAGAILEGPALVEEATTTSVVWAGQRASVDRFGLLSIEERG
jgi:N-methylhydantoinase A